MAQDSNVYELQLSVMRTVMEALVQLDDGARESVLSWIDGQFGRKERSTTTSVTRGPETSSHSMQRREGTVSVIAQKIGAKSARDLFLAAAAHLTLFQGKDTFTRDELVVCAKDARGWKSDYSNQISMSIGRMRDAGTLFEKAKNVFSLSEESLTKIEGALK